MLWTLTNDDSIKFKQSDYDYLASKISPDKKSNILVIDFDGGEYVKNSHKDYVTLDNVEIDLLERCVKSLGLTEVGTMIAIMVPAGVPILPHVHTTAYKENHFQKVMGLTPSGQVKGLYLNGRRYDSNSNRIMLNVKHNHWVAPQNEPTIWITPFGGFGAPKH